MPGVDSADVDVANGTATVHVAPGTDPEDLIRAIEDASTASNTYTAKLK